jgi:hypothetical protein
MERSLEKIDFKASLPNEKLKKNKIILDNWPHMTLFIKKLKAKFAFLVVSNVICQIKIFVT